MTGILFLSHTHASGPFRVGSHHYAATLARSGADVVHLSTPVSLAHRATGRVDSTTAAALPTRPTRDEAGVLHVVPRTMLPRPYGPFRVDRALAHLGLPTRYDAVFIDQPLLWDASVRALSATLVYRPTDLYPDGVKATLQREIVAAADGVVATSDEVLSALGPLTVPTIVLANGVDVDHFATAGDEPRPPLCVYVGALDARFDWGQLGAWARAYPDVRFAIAGPDAAPPAALPGNVDLLGPVDYSSLPALLQTARIGLLPLSEDPLNTGRSPMKLHEYLASGLTVVARETPVLRADGAIGVFTYSDPTTAAAALVAALAAPSPNQGGIAAAAEASWEAKTRALTTFVRELHGA